MARSPLEHDVIGVRLSLIIERLIEGHALSVADLATEFNVSAKTIYRDINQRLVHMDIERLTNGKYQLSPSASKGKRTDNDIIRFAKITNIHELFPSFDRKLVATLLGKHQAFPFVIYTQPLKEKLSTFSGFNVITQAIIEHKCLAFAVQGKEGDIKSFEPYRFIYFQQEWYLVGKYHSRITVYTHSCITNPKLMDDCFMIDGEVIKLTQDKEFICSLPHFQYLAKFHQKR